MQQAFLFESGPAGSFTSSRETNLEQLNAMLKDGWRVVAMSPTSSPTTSAGAEWRVFTLVILEK